MSVFLVGICVNTIPTAPRMRALSISALLSYVEALIISVFQFGAVRRPRSPCIYFVALLYVLSVWRVPPGLGLVDFGEDQDRIC